MTLGAERLVLRERRVTSSPRIVRTKAASTNRRAGACISAGARVLEVALPAFLIAALLWLGLLSPAIAQAPPATLSDNAESIAVVVGNKAYKQTSTVDFAHNDAEAIKAT
jgi:hypothetical protein